MGEPYAKGPFPHRKLHIPAYTATTPEGYIHPTPQG
jgi:hypothetical protein